jgi:cytochrome b561
MALTSTTHRYGSVAAGLHWLSAVVLFALVASGLRLEAMAGASGTADLLRLHLSLGLVVFALTLARILWWVFADRHPEPVGGGAVWQARAARPARYSSATRLPCQTFPIWPRAARTDFWPGR